jgi:hypothetical protein
MLDNDLKRLLPWAAALITAAWVSCAKSDSPAPTLGYSKIDDMEGQGGRIGWSPPVGQPGFWTSSTYCSQADRILPEPYFLPTSRWFYDQIPVPYLTMPGVKSTHAARLRTKFNDPLRGVWGANMGFDFAERTDGDGPARSDPAAAIDGGASSVDGGGCTPGSSLDFKGVPVNLTAYSGFTFWAMASPSGRQAIRVQVNDPHTDPRAGICNAGSTDESLCYNGYGKALMLTSTFAQYRVDFSELQQDPNWGYLPNDVPLDLNNVYSMNFLVALPGCADDDYANCAGGPAPVSFDVWIDDLYFVNRP